MFTKNSASNTGGGETTGAMPPSPPPHSPLFCVRKNKKRDTKEKERVSKQKLLKDCQDQIVPVL